MENFYVAFRKGGKFFPPNFRINVTAFFFHYRLAYKSLRSSYPAPKGRISPLKLTEMDREALKQVRNQQ